MKKIETKTTEKYYCDICGKEADGDYLVEFYLNGNLLGIDPRIFLKK